MIKFEKTEVVGWEPAIRGMRNPMNSWKKSDSDFKGDDGDYYNVIVDTYGLDSSDHFILGSNDLDLMKKLVASGTDHRKFMRMIIVYVDITAPLYWWKEFDTYKVGTVANSCSTMHKIAAKEFTLDDFSHEHLTEQCIWNLKDTIKLLNMYRRAYIYTDIDADRDCKKLSDESVTELKKDAWWQMIQLLPSSYNQKRTVMLSYEVLANIYKSRKDHKLDEWSYSSPGSFCDWIANLPYSELITRTDDPITKYCTEDIKIIAYLYSHAKSLGEGAIPKDLWKKDNPALDQNFMSKFQGEPWNKSEEKEKENE